MYIFADGGEFDMDDRILFTSLQEGDEDAYKTLMLKYGAPLTEYASQFIVDCEAEELVQDLMLYLWEAREYIVIETSLKSYLYAAVKNRCLNAIKKKLYHERIHSALHMKLREQFEEPGYYIIDELYELVTKAIEGLPESYRETFKLSRFGELSNARIANHLDVSVKTVEYRMTRALKILRTKLSDYLPIIAFLL